MLKRVGVTYPCLWGWIRVGRFPPARAVGDGRKGHMVWVEREVVDWMLARPPRIPKGSKWATEKSVAS